jgi:hypothetical protein
MNPPKIDRASVALGKEIDAKIRADAEYELTTRMQSMSATERAKLKSLLNNITFLGDVGGAAAKSRVSRELLDKWMNMPGISWHINTAFNEAQASLHCGRTADDVLWWAKIAPELKKDAEVFKATGQRHRESRVIAKLAAQDLKGYRWHILQAANNNDKQFLIDLGRCLTGELSTDFHDRLDYDVADICCQNRSVTSKQAVQELGKRGHKNVSEEAFRMRKARLGLTKSVGAAKCNKFS